MTLPPGPLSDTGWAGDPDRRVALEALHEGLADGIAVTRTDEGWRDWLRAVSKLRGPGFSFENTVRILGVIPDAELVAGRRAWEAVDRTIRQADRDRGVLVRVPGSRDGTPRTTRVWDITQTEGRPLPSTPGWRLPRRTPAGLWDALAGVVTAAGYTVHRGEPPGDAKGWTDYGDKTVTVRPDLTQPEAATVLAHELGHVLLPGGARAPAQERSCYGLREVEAESVGYLLLAAHGVDNLPSTLPYVTFWSAQQVGPDRGQLGEDVVRQVGDRVLRATEWALAHLERRTPAQAQTAHLAEQFERLNTRIAAGAARASTARGIAQAERDAAARLAQRTVSPRSRPGAEAWTREPDSRRVRAAYAEAVTLFRPGLHGSWAARGLSGIAAAAALDRQWNLGRAPSEWTALVEDLRGNGFSADVLLSAGLAERARTGHVVDRFRDRLTFPLHDEAGAVVGLVGMARDSDRRQGAAAFVSTPVPAGALYGLHEALDLLAQGAQPVLVTDPLQAVVISAVTQGRCAGLAAVPELTTAHVQRLAALPAVRDRGLTLGFDPDVAARREGFGRTPDGAALRQLFDAHGVLVTAAPMADGGPLTVLGRAGPDALADTLVDRAVPMRDGVAGRRPAAPVAAADRATIAATDQAAGQVWAVPYRRIGTGGPAASGQQRRPRDRPTIAPRPNPNQGGSHRR